MMWGLRERNQGFEGEGRWRGENGIGEIRGWTKKRQEKVSGKSEGDRRIER
jgi:hypothetical protein